MIKALVDFLVTLSNFKVLPGKSFRVKLSLFNVEQ